MIFVRHPFERLASAYQDKIAPSLNRSESVYTEIRRSICRTFVSSYNSEDQSRILLEQQKNSKEKVDFCSGKTPHFEHFVQTIVRGAFLNDVHWKPFSSLCQVCRIKYNFIGRYETIDEDLRRLRSLFPDQLARFESKNFFSSGKTRDEYRTLFSQLRNKEICTLKFIYRDDFFLFNYRIEDFLATNRSIIC